jgi:uncharacterized RDD family membrane protein YckC
VAYQTPPGYVPPYMPPAPTGPVIASFGRRVGALIIDVIILGIVAAVIAVALNVPGVQQTTTVSSGGTSTSFSVTNSGWVQVISAIVSVLYCVGSWLLMAGTPGQRMLGMHVYQVSGPQALTLEAAVIRWLLLFGIMTGVGAVAVLSVDLTGVVGLAQLAWLVVLIYTTIQSPMKQGIHDKYAQSIVVRN